MIQRVTAHKATHRFRRQNPRASHGTSARVNAMSLWHVPKKHKNTTGWYILVVSIGYLAQENHRAWQIYNYDVSRKSQVTPNVYDIVWRSTGRFLVTFILAFPLNLSSNQSKRLGLRPHSMGWTIVHEGDRSLHPPARRLKVGGPCALMHNHLHGSVPAWCCEGVRWTDHQRSSLRGLRTGFWEMLERSLYLMWSYVQHCWTPFDFLEHALSRKSYPQNPPKEGRHVSTKTI